MYSTKEAAQELRVSEVHLIYLLAKGDVDGKKLGRDWVVLNLDYKRKRKPTKERVMKWSLSKKLSK